MKEQCRNCQFSQAVPQKTADQSIKAQSDMESARMSVVGKGKAARLEAIEGVVTSKPNEELIKAHGGFSMSKKETDTGGVYVVCSNADNLKDEDAKKEGIVYKYYHSCQHFAAKSE